MADQQHPSDRNTKGKPPTPAGTAKRMATALDRELIDQLRKGVPAFNADGTPVIGEDGQQVRRPATAAVLNAARQRIQDLKREASRAGDPSAYESEYDELDAIARGMSNQTKPAPPPPDPAQTFGDAIARERQADEETDAPLRMVQ